MNRIWIPQLTVICLLLWALNPSNPYSYYILLRWVCCAAFAYLALRAIATEQQDWVWILGLSAVIYNPVFPVHQAREIWTVINVATIVLAVVSILALKPINSGHGTTEPSDGEAATAPQVE
jgi:FtsH-binding integral membrane protein